MKKLSLFVLVIAMVLFFVGCAADTTDNGSSNGAVNEENGEANENINEVSGLSPLEMTNLINRVGLAT